MVQRINNTRTLKPFVLKLFNFLLLRQEIGFFGFKRRDFLNSFVHFSNFTFQESVSIFLRGNCLADTDISSPAKAKPDQAGRYHHYFKFLLLLLTYFFPVRKQINLNQINHIYTPLKAKPNATVNSAASYCNSEISTLAP